MRLLYHVVFASFSRSFRTHSRSKTANQLNGVKDPVTTLCQENRPPIRSAGHGFGSHKDHQGWASPHSTGSYCRVRAPAYRSKTAEEIKCLSLICRAWSSEAKGTLNYKQPDSKGKSVKHLLPGTPHSALGLPGFSRPINWHCWYDLSRIYFNKR